MSDADYLSLQRLTLAHGAATVVDALDLTVQRGEIVALLGPSGCGKTTTMRAIAGLLNPRSGTIHLGGRDITHIAPNKRDIGLVFQSYALFPHLTVAENLAFGLRLRHLSAAEIAKRVEAMLETVDLAGMGDRLPRQLSGGQQQRVALARAIVVEPRLLLLDEPLSNLDASLRMEMRGELRRLQQTLGITMIYVTHDQSEALALADRVAVMRAGKIEQLADPETVFDYPSTPFIARFMGFDAVFPIVDDKLESATGGQMPYGDAGQLPVNTKALAWRPRNIVIGSGPYRAHVILASYLGDTVEYLLDTPLGEIKAATDAAAPRHPIGKAVAFDLPLAKAARLDTAH
ncbi:MAG TPA: ABC transporter ATP-binding protein [Magnetospirillaceae bacterium]|jgi:putative spermidine/putrescine transport system ATP-binding protein